MSHELPLNCYNAILWVPGTLFGERRETLALLRDNIPAVSSKVPTARKATKGALHLQATTAASRGHPALHLPHWGNSLQKQTQGIWCMIMNLKLGMVTTFPSAVVLAWVSNPSFPRQPIPAAFSESSLSTAVSRALHIVGHLAIQIQVNFSLYE